MQRATRVVACLVGLAFCCVGGRAEANGRFPRADQIVVAPGRPDELVLRATFGLVVSRDAGTTWDWICERAIGYAGIEDPAVGMMANGVVLAGLFEGLAQSSNDGCSWAFVGGSLAARNMIDLTVRSDTATAAVALSWERQLDGGPGYRSLFFATADNGMTWAPSGVGIDPTVLVLTVDTAPSDSHRLYASGVRETEDGRVASLFVSTDDGASWIERPAPFDSRIEQGLYIAAVDPHDADLVYLRTSGASTSRLLVTSDAGVSFDVRYAGIPMLAFALSPDGQQIYFGGTDGLRAGAASGATFEQRSSVRLTCLAATSDTLYACSDQSGGFIVGASSDGGFTFAPKLYLTTVRGPLACGGDASVSVCSSDWPALRTLLGIPGDSVDGGARDATSNDVTSSDAAASPSDASSAADGSRGEADAPATSGPAPADAPPGAEPVDDAPASPVEAGLTPLPHSGGSCGCTEAGRAGGNETGGNEKGASAAMLLLLATWLARLLVSRRRNPADTSSKSGGRAGEPSLPP